MKTDKINNIIEKLNIILKLLEENVAFLSFEEACKYLNISKHTLYRMSSDGIIIPYKPGGKKIYFSKNRLEQLGDWKKTFEEIFR